MDNKTEDKDYWRIYNQGHAKGFITGMYVSLAQIKKHVHLSFLEEHALLNELIKL